MTLNYPNGQHYSQKQSTTFKAKHKSPSRIVYGNRGMTLEQEINDSNQYYLEREIAVIHKKPIPIQIVDVEIFFTCFYSVVSIYNIWDDCNQNMNFH